jgi:hypothetical protein
VRPSTEEFNAELTTADWNEVRKLLSLNDVQLHQLRLAELRKGADRLRALSDLCMYTLRRFYLTRIERGE